MKPTISIIVCTYNRADMLPQCLKSLCEQTLDPSQYEVIVVDNGSTDRTKEIAEAFGQRYAHLHYHVEPKQGLGHARNRGLELAQGRYSAYIDDDARASQEYLENAVHLFESVHPSPHCLGGPEEPWYTTSKPAWFKDDYGSRRMWPCAKLLTKNNSFSGCNQIWETETLRKLGGFNVHLGVTGTMMGMGEETAVFYKAWDVLENPQFYYSPCLVVYHWVPESKISVTYQLKRRFTEAQCTAALAYPSLRAKCACFATRPYWLARAILRLILNVRAHPDQRNWLVEDLGRGVRLLGEMVGCFTTRPLFKQR